MVLTCRLACILCGTQSYTASFSPELGFLTCGVSWLLCIQKDVIVCVFPPSLWHLVADFLVCGFALFLVLVFAFNLSFKPDYISLVLVMLERVLFFRLHIWGPCNVRKRLAPHLVLGLALGLDHILAHLPRVRDTGLHIVIPNGTHSSP